MVATKHAIYHPSLSHVESEYHESLIQGKILIQQNLNEGHDYL